MTKHCNKTRHGFRSADAVLFLRLAASTDKRARLRGAARSRCTFINSIGCLKAAMRCPVSTVESGGSPATVLPHDLYRALDIVQGITRRLGSTS